MEKKLEQCKVKDQDIAQLLQKYNDKIHGRGETLPEHQQVFRVKVVKTFLQAGISLSKVGHFESSWKKLGIVLLIGGICLI